MTNNVPPNAVIAADSPKAVIRYAARLTPTERAAIS
jgi:hypothetical protein